MDTNDFFVKRKATRDERDRSVNVFGDEYARAEFPLLHAFVAQREVSGNSRKLGKIILFAEDGRLKACLKDPDAAEVLFVTLSGYEACFQELNAALADPGADWRKSRR